MTETSKDERLQAVTASRECLHSGEAVGEQAISVRLVPQVREALIRISLSIAYRGLDEAVGWVVSHCGNPDCNWRRCFYLPSSPSQRDKTRS